MRVGIITMISDNYGNRLQNYALQQTIKKIGVEVETFHNPFLYSYSEVKHVLKKPIKIIIYSLSKIKREILKRENLFEEFNKNYIVWSKFWLNNQKHLLRINSYYDKVISGSDQVWNPESNNIDGRYFGTFVSAEKRLSYAASFGISTIPRKRRTEWTEYLENMESISVREENGIQIVRDLTGKDCEQHLDPTLLLGKEEWRKLESKPKNIDFSKKYILTYFLGIIDSEQENYINNLALKMQCNVYNMNRIDLPELYSCGPCEFLYLIDKAECILTDSFHGTVFSILFEKKFKVFKRKGLKNSMYSRLESLLKILNLSIVEENTYDFEKEIVQPDYKNIFYIIEKEKQRSIDYLRKIIM